MTLMVNVIIWCSKGDLLMSINFNKIVGIVALLAVTGVASASSIASTDSFYNLYKFLNTAASGGLGVGIALAALLVGAGIGAAKASALPAVGGVVIAAMFGFGPKLILDLVANGALLA